MLPCSWTDPITNAVYCTRTGLVLILNTDAFWTDLTARAGVLRCGITRGSADTGAVIITGLPVGAGVIFRASVSAYILHANTSTHTVEGRVTCTVSSLCTPTSCTHHQVALAILHHRRRRALRHRIFAT